MRIKKYGIILSILNKAITQIIVSEMSYIRLSSNDKIGANLRDYFNMTELVNPSFSSANKGEFEFVQPYSFSHKNNQGMIDERCELRDSHPQWGVLFLCDNKRVVVIGKDMSSVRSINLGFPPFDKSTCTRQIYCKATLFAYNQTELRGIYTICLASINCKQGANEQQSKTYISFNDAENKFGYVYTKHTVLGLNFDNKAISAYQETDGKYEILLCEDVFGESSSLIVHLSGLVDSREAPDVITINLMGRFKPTDLSIKDVFPMPKSINKDNFNFFVVMTDSNTRKEFHGYFFKNPQRTTNPFFKPMIKRAVNPNEYWRYFVDDDYTYNVTFSKHDTIYYLSIVIRKSSDILSLRITNDTFYLIDHIPFEKPISDVRFFSNGNSSLFQFLNASKSILNTVVFDKKQLSFCFNSSEGEWISAVPLGENFLIFQPNHVSYYILGTAEVLFDGQKILSKSKNQFFETKIILCFGVMDVIACTPLNVQGEVIQNLEDYLEKDLKIIPISVYNWVPLNLPIDMDLIRGSNLNFEDKSDSKYLNLDTKIFSQMVVDFRQFDDDCDLKLIDKWLLYTHTNKNTSKKEAVVYSIEDVQENSFRLEKKSDSPIVFSMTNWGEEIIEYSREGRYLVLLTSYKIRFTSTIFYNIYIAYEPNFAYSVFNFTATGDANIEIIAKTEIKDSKTLKLFFVGVKEKEIRIYDLYAENTEPKKLIRVMNSDTTKLNFCPTLITRGIIQTNFLIILSHCSHHSHRVTSLFVYDLEKGAIVRSIPIKEGHNLQMCLFFDQILLKPVNSNSIYGKKLSSFSENNIYYYNILDLTHANQMYCSKSSRVVVLEQSNSTHYNFIIYKGPNSFRYDKRIYDVISYKADRYEKIIPYEFGQNYFFFVKPVGGKKWIVDKVKTDSPAFQLESMFPEQYFEQDRDAIVSTNLTINVTSDTKGHTSMLLTFPLNIHKVEYYPYNVTKNKKMKDFSTLNFTNLTLIDNILDISGHFYDMVIEDGKSLRGNSNGKKLTEPILKMKYYESMKNVTLSSRIRFGIDFISRDEYFILGYHIYNGYIYIFDLELNYIKSVENEYQCTIGDHVSLKKTFHSQILIFLGCKVDDSLKLVSYLVDLQNSSETIKPVNLGAYNFGLFNNIKIYQMITDIAFLIRLDFEDFETVQLYHYTLEIIPGEDKESKQVYEDINLYRIFKNCTSFTSVGSVGYRIFLYTNKFVYEKIDFSVFIQVENEFKLVSKSSLDIKRQLGLELYTDTIACHEFDMKGTEISCLLVNRGIDFYEITIGFTDGNPPKLKLLSKRIFKKYMDFEFDQFAVGKDLIILQGSSKTLGGKRAMMVYSKKTPNEFKERKDNTGYLHFTLDQSEFTDDLFNPTDIQILSEDEFIIRCNIQKPGANRVIFQKIKLVGRMINFSLFENVSIDKLSSYNITFLNPMEVKLPGDSANFGDLVNNDKRKIAFIQFNYFTLIFLFSALLVPLLYAVKLDIKTRTSRRRELMQNLDLDYPSDFLFAVRLGLKVPVSKTDGSDGPTETHSNTINIEGDSFTSANSKY